MNYQEYLDADEEVISKLSSHERIQLIMALRQKVLEGEELTDAETRLSVRLLRAERDQRPEAKPKKKAEEPKVSVDLEDLFK